MKLLIAGSLLIWASMGSVALAQGKGDVAAGKAVYDSKCKICHGANGEGNAAIAKTLKVTLKDLKSKEVQGKTDADLKKQSSEGQGKMQPIKGLSDKQVEDLIAFIRSLAKA